MESFHNPFCLISHNIIVISELLNWHKRITRAPVTCAQFVATDMRIKFRTFPQCFFMMQTCIISRLQLFSKCGFRVFFSQNPRKKHHFLRDESMPVQSLYFRQKHTKLVLIKQYITSFIDEYDADHKYLC